MPNWARALIVGVVSLCLLGALSLIVLGSSQFQYCINDHHEQQHEPNGSENNNPPSFPVSGTYSGCLGQFANTNGNGITALSTLLLMVITAGLVVIGYMQIRTSRRQLRAYIFVDSTGVWDAGTHQNVPIPVITGCPNYAVAIKNFGQTPAYEVRHVSQIDICQAGQESRLALLSIPENEVPPSSIGPGSTTTTVHNLGRALTPFEIQSLAALGQSLIVHGRITYKDVLGIRRTTQYMVGFSGFYPPANPQPLIFTTTGNRAD